MSYLIISKGITKKSEGDPGATKDNVYKSKCAHVELAKKMKKRDPATAPGIGDRVQYLIIKGKVGSKQYMNAEDPLYVLRNNLPIDFNYYLEKQLKQPLTRIFKHIIPNPQSLFQGAHTKN